MDMWMDQKFTRLDKMYCKIYEVWKETIEQMFWASGDDNWNQCFITNKT